MKATELMIGDWVNLTYTDRLTKEIVSKNFQVTQMRDDYGVLCAWTKGKTCDHNMDAIDKLKPIPLTREIFENNGWTIIRGDFGKEPMYATKRENGFLLEYYFHEGIFRSYFIRPYFGEELVAKFSPGLNYVHQLQHALRFCGLGSEIRLLSAT